MNFREYVNNPRKQVNEIFGLSPKDKARGKKHGLIIKRTDLETKGNFYWYVMPNDGSGDWFDSYSDFEIARDFPDNYNMKLVKIVDKTGKKIKEVDAWKLDEAEIDQAKVKDAAISIAKKAYGDEVDQEKVDGMVKKAISIAKDTEDAIGIVQGFFQEEKEEDDEEEKIEESTTPKFHASKILEGMNDSENKQVSVGSQVSTPIKSSHGNIASKAFDLL